MSSLFLSGATLVHMDPPRVQTGNLRVLDGRIDAVGPHVQPRADEQVLSMKGRLILPGLVAVLKGEVEDETGLEVVIGPEEAAGIPGFLKNEWSLAVD